MSISTTVKKAHSARLKPGGDLVEEVGAFLDDHGISFGMVSIIGALRRATLGSYDFEADKYVTFEIDEVSELLHCGGNVSLLDGKPFAHLHAVVAGLDGKAMGGHVFTGTEIKVAELIVLEFDGDAPQRVEDPETGLKLWTAEE